jgi:hypothetical protein
MLESCEDDSLGAWEDIMLGASPQSHTQPHVASRAAAPDERVCGAYLSSQRLLLRL